MNDQQTTWKVWQDRDVADRFTGTERGGILGADAQMSTMRRLIALVPSENLTVLDLGCGDGILLETVMRSFPVARAVALDGSPAMLEKAEVRFEGLGLFSNLVEFVEADFDSPEWLRKLPVSAFDVVVSGFAIHHSEDDRKRALYEELFELLKPGGLFVNIEHVASASSIGEELFQRACADTVADYRLSLGIETNEETVYEEIRSHPDKAANRLTLVETQCGWLREIGFRDVDCFWKHYELAVFGGFK
jgi:ubiquinone/menaquinone biosynthesis C-methylase UbiE